MTEVNQYCRSGGSNENKLVQLYTPLFLGPAAFDENELVVETPRRPQIKPKQPKSFFGFSGRATGESKTVARGQIRKRGQPGSSLPTKLNNPPVVYSSYQQRDPRIRELQELREMRDEKEAAIVGKTWKKADGRIIAPTSLRVVCRPVLMEETRKKRRLNVDTISIPGLMFFSWT